MFTERTSEWKHELFSQRKTRVSKAAVVYLHMCKAKSLHSCLTLCDPIDGSPPGSPVPGILQARTLEGGGISFYNAWKWKVKVKSLSRVWPLATPWTAAHQAPPFMRFPGRSTGVGCHCLLRLPSLTTLYKISPLLQRKGPPQEFPGSPWLRLLTSTAEWQAPSWLGN